MVKVWLLGVIAKTILPAGSTRKRDSIVGSGMSGMTVSVLNLNLATILVGIWFHRSAAISNHEMILRWDLVELCPKKQPEPEFCHDV